jgi:hypothetical protein
MTTSATETTDMTGDPAVLMYKLGLDHGISIGIRRMARLNAQDRADENRYRFSLERLRDIVVVDERIPAPKKGK